MCLFQVEAFKDQCMILLLLSAVVTDDISDGGDWIPG